MPSPEVTQAHFAVEPHSERNRDSGELIGAFSKRGAAQTDSQLEIPKARRFLRS